MHTQKAGFTLIEVLVALMILAIGALAIVKTSQSSIQVSMRLQDDIIAHIVAGNKLARLQAGMSVLLPDQKKVSGIDVELNRVWYWTLRVTQKGSGLSSHYDRVNIAVAARQGGSPLVNVIGFVPRPIAQGQFNE